MSARRTNRNLRPLFVIGIIAIAIAWFAWPSSPERVLQANDAQYSLETVTTPEAMINGLGGRASLPKDTGMLFAYDQSAPNRCFWMKNMRFPIDIIWLGAGKKVVYIEHSVAPNTYPKEFCAGEPSQFVIELNAGEAHRANIRTGQTLRF